MLLWVFSRLTDHVCPQADNVEGMGLGLGIVEVFSAVFFTVDYAARVVSAGAEGGDGVMSYVISFYGLVDLLSFLPFYMALPAFGGIGALSPKLLPTLVSFHCMLCVQ